MENINIMECIKRSGFKTDCCQTFVIENKWQEIKDFIQKVDNFQKKSEKVNFPVEQYVSV